MDRDLQITDFELSEFGPPDKAGVYLVCMTRYFNHGQPPAREHVIYVGSSSNIYKRVMNPTHPYRQLYDSAEWPLLVVTRSLVTDDYKRVELEAIRTFRPPMNIRYGG